MKKFTIFALTAVLAAGLLTACRAPAMDETTDPSTTVTSPSTQATAPSTTTTPSTTPPASTGASDPTETTGGTNTMDPGKSLTGMLDGNNGR